MIENNLGLSSAAAAQNNASLCNVYVSASDASAWVDKVNKINIPPLIKGKLPFTRVCAFYENWYK